MEGKEIVIQLEQMAEELARLSNSAVFINSPRFDQEMILDVKALSLDPSRLLIVLITDFGTVKTEILYLDNNTFGAKRIENYFRARLLNLAKPENLSEEEETAAKKFYNEVIMRFFLGTTHFFEEDLFRTGFSNLLNYTEFSLNNGLSLFENKGALRRILRECLKLNTLKVWIGEDLLPYSAESSDLAIVAIPYKIHNRPVGAVALLGPTRIPYQNLFGLVSHFSDCLSTLLTKNIYKFKIQVKQTEERQHLLESPKLKLLEDKRR